MRPADKLQLKAAIILRLVGLARSKQDPVNCGHGAQYLYRPPPAGAKWLSIIVSTPELHGTLAWGARINLFVAWLRRHTALCMCLAKINSSCLETTF